MFGLSLEVVITSVATLLAFFVLLKLSFKKDPIVEQGEKNLKIAMEIGKNIKNEVKIQDLIVACSSTGLVSLSGMSSSQKDIDHAGKIASLHPHVKTVSNGILKFT